MQNRTLRVKCSVDGELPPKRKALAYDVESAPVAYEGNGSHINVDGFIIPHGYEIFLLYATK